MRRLLVSGFVFFLLACGTPPPAPDGGNSELLDGGAARVDAGQPAPDAGASDAGAVAVVRVHYTAGSTTMFLRGSVPPASWTVGLAMAKVDDSTWTMSLPALQGTMELKPMLGDTTWAKGPNWTVKPGQVLEVWPRFVTDTGQWSKRWSFSSTLLGNTRGVYVYLPPTYLENTAYRAPVLYMHDGQNLFDPAAAFGGVTWKVPETLDAAAQDGSMLEPIVVGPENAGGARIDEYTPTADASYGGGKGDLYLRMLIEELKPKVDAELRTRPGRESTALVGSSLGGLITSYAGVRHPEVFGLVGVVSPSTWWDNRMLLGEVAATRASPNRPLMVYVDCGDSGDGLADTNDLVQKYRDVGYVEGKDLRYVVQPGASHTERYWAERLPGALRFLLGPAR